ncbi:MAG TPA: LysR substrate-binding domain-containing protein, partial [Methylocystis sp.]|nr:LysR substrate-binding domain-containing protein [Methylocystis sp.]
GGEDALQGVSVERIGQDRLTPVTAIGRTGQVRLRGGRLEGPVMVYTPGTSYGAQIAAMLAAHGVVIAEQPICESASAEALLAQAVAGLGAAWIPQMLAKDAAVERCSLPETFDIAYKIALVRPPLEH